MYKINTTGEVFPSFSAAVKAAQIIGADVHEVSTGLRRWAPAEPVAKKRQRMYRERLAARAAYEQMVT